MQAKSSSAAAETSDNVKPTDPSDVGVVVGEVKPAIPKAITNAEADLATKAAIRVAMIQTPEMIGNSLVRSKAETHKESTSGGAIGKQDLGSGPLGSNQTNAFSPLVPTTSLQRAQHHQLAASTPGAFDVSGADGGELVVDDSSDEEEQVSLGTNDHSDHAGLAVAAPVGDLDALEDARPVLSQDDQAKVAEKKESRFWMTIGALIAIAVVVFLIIFVAAERSDDNNDNNTNSTASNDTTAFKEPFEVLTALLPNETLSFTQISDTPQGMAFEWVIQDPNFGSYSEKRLRQRFALATFYYSTHGEQWGPTWLDRTQHECQWEYFMPSNEQYNVLVSRYEVLKYIDGPCVPVGVEFDKSTIVTANSTLEHDDYLYLAFANQPLTGEIPPEITMLTALKLIQLDYTMLEGTIPKFFFDFQGLLGLHLQIASMTGTIPTEIGKLTELRMIDISVGRGLTGTLPTEIGLLSNLEILTIVETGLTGPIPVEYTALDLYEFQVHSNFLNGTIPTEFGLWTRIDWVGIWGNELVRMSCLICGTLVFLVVG